MTLTLQPMRLGSAMIQGLAWHQHASHMSHVPVGNFYDDMCAGARKAGSCLRMAGGLACSRKTISGLSKHAAQVSLKGSTPINMS